MATPSPSVKRVEALGREMRGRIGERHKQAVLFNISTLERQMQSRAETAQTYAQEFVEIRARQPLKGLSPRAFRVAKMLASVVRV